MLDRGKHVCIGKHDVGRGVCRHFGLIGFTATKFYSDSFSTKKHSLDYYHCIIWLYYCLPLLYIIAPWFKGIKSSTVLAISLGLLVITNSSENISNFVKKACVIWFRRGESCSFLFWTDAKFLSRSISMTSSIGDAAIASGVFLL